MAALKFNNYVVDHLIYRNNPNFNSQQTEIEIEPDISVTINKDQETAVVNLEVKLNNNQENPVYTVDVGIIGFFEYKEKEAENHNFKDLLTSNAIAILFPYARALISDITAKSNLYPNFNFPVINVVELLKKEEKIFIIENE